MVPWVRVLPVAIRNKPNLLDSKGGHCGLWVETTDNSSWENRRINGKVCNCRWQEKVESHLYKKVLSIHFPSLINKYISAAKSLGHCLHPPKLLRVPPQSVFHTHTHTYMHKHTSLYIQHSQTHADRLPRLRHFVHHRLVLPVV